MNALRMADVRERVQYEHRGVHQLQHGLPADLRLWWIDLETYAAAISLEPGEAPHLAGDPPEEHISNRRWLLASRHASRWLLAESLGRAPEQLVIEIDPAGKPRLSDGAIRFNLSHSGRFGLVGICREREVGVDVEIIRPVPELDALVNAQFTNTERAEWLRTAPANRNRRFLETWTRKEACAKAMGTGFLIAPLLFAVGAGPEQVSVRIDPPGGPAREVTVRSVQPCAEAVAAVAIV
jgi:4'-phosphopantetheinyl transferase